MEEESKDNLAYTGVNVAEDLCDPNGALLVLLMMTKMIPRLLRTLISMLLL